MPHNVKITDTPAQANVIFDGEIVTGPTQVTYQVPAIQAGDGYFLCDVHPNMNGTLQARPETGGPGAAPGRAVLPRPVERLRLPHADRSPSRRGAGTLPESFSRIPTPATLRSRAPS